MARKLINDYTFNKAARQVTINGNVSTKKLLLINNLTAGATIFNPTDSTAKVTATSYSSTADTTTFTLQYDTTGMSNTDTLQIFTEDMEGVVFKPQESLLDPVHKLRVSEPNTLIQTDFEYGLQAIKWESLQRSNNVPGFYSNLGDTPLSNISDVQTNGTSTITVLCTSSHGLTSGTPIDVRGLNNLTAEGTFIVRKTTDNTFTYDCGFVQPGTTTVPQSIVTSYTTVTSGRFYVQCAIPFDNSTTVDEGPVITDAASPSTLTVSTPYKHGFKQGSPFYLTNTLSNKRLGFAASSIISAGNVDDRVSYPLDTGYFNPYEPVHNGTSLRTITAPGAIDITGTGANPYSITIPNHGLNTGDPITYLGSTGSHPTIAAVSTGEFSVAAGNLPTWNNGNSTANSAVFYAVVLDQDTIRLATNPKNAYNGDVLVQFTVAGTGTLTFSLFNKRGTDIASSITKVDIVNGQSEIKVTLATGTTNKSLGIYPEMQFTIDGTGGAPGTTNGLVDGVFYVMSTPSYYSANPYRETDNFFILKGPTGSAATFVPASLSTRTVTLSNTASSTNTLIRNKLFESTVTPTISSVSGSTLTVSALTNLANGDLPIRPGSTVRFTAVGSITGITAGTTYWVSAVTSTSITLSSTNPAIATTALTLGGTPGVAAAKVFTQGIRCQVHDATASWLNHMRASIHDFASITAKMFTRECIKSGTDTIFIKNHGLVSGVPVMYVGAGNTWTGGSPPTEAAANAGIYYISPQDNDRVQIYSSITTGGSGPYGSSPTTLVNFTTANTWAGGVYALHPGFDISNFTQAAGGSGQGRDRVIGTFSNWPSYLTESAQICLKLGTGSSFAGNGLTDTPNTYASFQKYYARTVINSGPISSAAEFSVSLADTTSPINFTATATVGAGRFFGMRIKENTYSNSFYLPFHGGVAGQRTSYSISGSFTGGTTDTQSTYPGTTGFPGPLFDYITDSTGVSWPRVYMTMTQATAAITGLTSGSKYYMVPITDNIFKVQAYVSSTLPTGQPTIQFSQSNTAAQATTSVAGPLGTTQIKFANSAVSNQNGNRIIVPVESQVLVEGDVVRYETAGNPEIGSAYAGAPGLVNGNEFFAKNVNNNVILSTSLYTVGAVDATATTITLNTSVGTNISQGNTLYTGKYLNEKLLVTNVSGSTITVTRGYSSTVPSVIPDGTPIYKIHGSFQLVVRETATPRTFSVTSGNTSQGNDTWTSTGHNLRVGETVYIVGFSTSGAITDTITATSVNTTAPLRPYYAIYIDANTFQLASSKAAAYAGFPLDITAAGSGGSWTFTQYYDAIPLSSGASGTHYLTDLSSTGNIDGIFNASGTPSSTKLTFNPGYQINYRDTTFDPARNIDLKTGTIYYQAHGFQTGMRVNYSKNNLLYEIGRAATAHPRAGYTALNDIQLTGISTTGTQVTYTYSTVSSGSPFDIVPNQSINVYGVTVGGSTNNGYNGTFTVVSSTNTSVTVNNTTTGGSPVITNGFVANSLYVIRKNLDQFQLAYTKADALAGNAIQNFSTTGTTGAGHTFRTYDVTGEILGNGVATVVARDQVINGSSTSATNGISAASCRINYTSHGFSTGDRIIYQVWGNGVAINGLISGKQYFINNTQNLTTSRGGAGSGQQANQFSLHNSWVGAYTNTDLVTIFGVGQSTLHQFKVTNPTMVGTIYKGDWNSADNYVYGDVVQFRNAYYMAVSGNTANYNNNAQPTADSSGYFNLNWMLLPPLPSYSTKFLTQYRGNDTVTLSGKNWVTTPFFAGSAANTTTGVFNVSSHGLATGDAVFYRTDAHGGNHQGSNGSFNEYVSNTPQPAHTNMIANQIYYINVIDSSNFTIHTSPSGAFIGGSSGTGADQVIPGNQPSGSYYRFEKLEPWTWNMNVIAVNTDSQMIVSDPYPSVQIIFNPQSTVYSVSGLATPVVNIDRNELYLPNHGLQTGVKVYYSAGYGIGNVIGGLGEGSTYYVIKVNDNAIRLASTVANAFRLNSDVTLTSTGAGFNHYLVAASYCGSSYVRYQSSGTLATDTGFFTSNNYLYSAQNSSNIAAGVIQALPFIYQTQMFVRPSCLNIHRPFDGGIQIQSGPYPQVSIVRQTRKYFRYQSGKGFQYSTGINFSPALDVAYITHDGTQYATVVTRFPHNLSANNRINFDPPNAGAYNRTDLGIQVSSGSAAPYYTPSNGLYFTVYDVQDAFTFRYATNGIPTDLAPSGYPKLFVYSWTGAYSRCGMFDDQNGLFFEYDGQNLYAVRRKSTDQLSGVVTATNKSNVIVGSQTKFTKQLTAGDKIVIRGMTYKVTSVDSDTNISISPSYRGTTRSNIVMCKTFDIKAPTSSWNIDKCDGTGPTGYILNINKQQMAYIDFSWYGAGKARFGFKATTGQVFYCHEFIHNNKENEAYMRSGNLPARYEVENGDNPTYYPSIYHWGASVIMDGKYEDDKAYLFTVASGSAGSDTISIAGGLAGTVVPVLSLRLAPSVDSSLVGPIGERDLINRMIITLNDCGVVIGNASNKPASVRLILNANLSQSAYFANYGVPSLTQIIKHTGAANDTATGGLTVYEFRAATGSQVTADLSALTEIGNSILGGDFVYPNGPDILTLAIVPTDTAAVTTCTARISWKEAQA